VFVVGGSSGAAHAAWNALDLVDTTNNGWGLSELPKAIVGLSGCYNLASRDADTQDQVDRFIDIVINYTNINNPNAGDPGQDAVAAISRIPLIAVNKIPPMRLYNSEEETMPHQQMDTFAAALTAYGFTDFLARTLDGAMHAFHCWPVEISPGLTVGKDVIAFLDAHL
jgi:hypothetical protein